MESGQLLYRQRRVLVPLQGQLGSFHESNLSKFLSVLDPSLDLLLSTLRFQSHVPIDGVNRVYMLVCVLVSTRVWVAHV